MHTTTTVVLQYSTELFSSIPVDYSSTMYSSTGVQENWNLQLVLVCFVYCVLVLVVYSSTGWSTVVGVLQYVHIRAYAIYGKHIIMNMKYIMLYITNMDIKYINYIFLSLLSKSEHYTRYEYLSKYLGVLSSVVHSKILTPQALGGWVVPGLSLGIREYMLCF